MIDIKRNRIFRLFLVLYNTVFFIGYIKYFPGTFASLFSLLFFYLCYYYFGNSFLSIAIVLIFVLTTLSFLMVRLYLVVFEPEDLDSKEIVIDEFLGQFFVGLLWMILSLFTDLYHQKNILLYMSIFFFLFRFFDILKPFPICWIDNRVKNSFGILLDDFIAAIFSFIFFITYFLILSVL